ncbi:MAG: leucine-rich repeat domain-containing protein [Aestuariibaculum sp.]
MKKLLLLFCTLSTYFCLSQTTFTDSGSGITFNVTSTSAPYTVEVGDNKTSFTGSAVNIPASVIYSGTTYAVTSFINGAFANNTNVTSAVIPNSITAIANGAFNNCTNLSSVTIPEGVTTIGNASFQKTALISITLPSTLTSIGNNTFKQSGLTSIVFPDSVTSIGNSAFNGCASLASVTFGENISSIGASSFAGTAISSIVIPASMSSIGGYAFNGCTNLANVTAEAVAPISIPLTVFNGVTATLHVPEGSQTAYESANGWNALTVMSANGLEKTVQFNLYPNPVNDVLNVSLDNPTALKAITIYNILGKTVLHSKEAQISVSSLQAGVYILKMETLEGSATKRFIKR